MSTVIEHKTGDDFFRDDLDPRPVIVTIKCLVYNHGPYLRQTLDGFVMQKTDFRFEVIAHDDCSTDDSMAILNEYSEIYPSIIKVLGETENLYSKGNGLIQKTMKPYFRGKYIAYCEGDDYWIDPLKLQKQVDYLEANPDCGLTYSRVRYFHHESGRFSEDWGGPKDTFEQLLVENTIPTLTVLTHMEYADNYHEAVLPRRNWLMGDYPQWLWTAMSHKVHFDNEVSGVYRVLRNSASHHTDETKRLRFQNSGVDIKLYFIERCGLNADNILTGQDLWIKIRWAVFNNDLKMLNEYYAKAKTKQINKFLLAYARFALSGGKLTCKLASGLLKTAYKINNLKPNH